MHRNVIPRIRTAWFPLVILLCWFGLQPICHAAESGQTSALWGESGELWSSTSRLPDFHLAGYACGRRAIPEYPVLTSVRDHGAKGDGVTDDTAAFQEAIRSVPEKGAVLVPAGRYVLGDVVEISRSGVVLRGEGPGRSILVIPKSLSEIHPRANVDKVKSAYSFTGGFITLRGQDTGHPLGTIAKAAKRGETKLILSTSGSIRAGDWIRVTMEDSADHSLLRHIHGELLNSGTDTYRMKEPGDWVLQVVGVDGNQITLDRPLRLDVRLEWNPKVVSFAPTLTESGVENLGFEFPGVPKRPHLEEAGFNALQFDGAVNCWIRNVSVTDADNGVIMGHSRFCTVDQFSTLAAKRTGLTGHHALWATAKTQDALVTRFRFQTTYVHDLTVEGFANGNVFTQGTGISVNCDHHRNGPYENLFTDFDAGDPKRLFESSGRLDRGPHSGARTTFWAIRGTGTFPKLPPAKEWPLVNLVGFDNMPESKETNGPWVEACGGKPIPANLWEAQVKKAGAR